MLNPYVLLGVGVAWLISLGAAAYLGKDYADGQCAKRELERKTLAEEIREANLNFSDSVAQRTATAIAGIRIQHRTINNEVRHEREIHHKVLENPDCAVPASTLRLLNNARGFQQDDRPRADQPAPAVPEAGAAAQRPTAPGR